LSTNRIEREKYLDKGHIFFQNKDSDFKTSKREFGKQNRYFSSNYFQRKLNNGEMCDRKWLLFSESAGAVFCYACKIFSSDQNNTFIKKGFCNWKKADEAITAHESSKEHHQCMVDWMNYLQKDSRIDQELVKQMESDIVYWTEILRRIIAVIRFLAERGLSFRGTNEIIGSPDNGNYLGIIELLSEFDPLLREHLINYANKGRGNVSYLSKTICEELIDLMSKKVLNHIINEIKFTKYWGLIVDSTPDLSHVDQLSVIFRYYLNGHIYERFVCFLQIKSHTGEQQSIDILHLLEEYGLNIKDCRAQTYDNASNMSGKYSGLQACLKKCVGHSLNLVGECSVNDNICSANFFYLLQNLYNFFSSSTHRWNILQQENGKLTSLSITRWSKRADAVSALVNNFTGIFNALSHLADD